MSASELAWRSVHDLGLAGWFGSSLAIPPASIAANGSRPTGNGDGTDADVGGPKEPKKKQRKAYVDLVSNGEPPQVPSTWVPVMLGSMALHLAGGAGLLAWNASRLAGQRGVVTSTVVKSAMTAAGVGLTLLAWRSQVSAEQPEHQGVSGADEERRRRSLERRRMLAGWLLPLTTGSIVVLGAMEGEQQRPREMARGLLANLPGVSP